MRTPAAASKVTRALVALLAALSFGAGLYAVAAPSLAAPTITVGPSDPTNMTSAMFTYTHKKNVTFRCSLDGASFTACGTARPSTKTYPGPLAPGSHVFRVSALSGTQTSAAASYSWTVDVASPAVASIDRSASSPTNAGAVAWTVTFSEAVSGVGQSDFALDNEGLTSPSLTSVTGSGAARTVTASTGSGAGTLTLDLVDDDSIRDLAGNPLGGGGAGNGSFHGPAYSIDRTAPPTPVFTQTPLDPSPTATATFAWTDTEPDVAFECSEENGRWVSCASPHIYEVEITDNEQHQFAVRAVDAAGNASGAVAYTWKVAKIDFTIQGTVGLLYPAVWRPIEVTITNPNSYDFELTSLVVSVAASPEGCPASSNIAFLQSPVSETHTVTIPRKASLTLSAADRPQIQLVNLPVSQDACKNGTFDLTYRGTGTK